MKLQLILLLAAAFTFESAHAYDYQKRETSETGKEEAIQIDRCEIGTEFNMMYNTWVPVATILVSKCIQKMTQDVGYTKRRFWFPKADPISGTQTMSADTQTETKKFQPDYFEAERLLTPADAEKKDNALSDFLQTTVAQVVLSRSVETQCRQFAARARMEIARNDGHCTLGENPPAQPGRTSGIEDVQTSSAVR